VPYGSSHSDNGVAITFSNKYDYKLKFQWNQQIIKTNRLMLFREIIAENRMKFINTPYKQNADFLNVKGVEHLITTLL
jgi:hypothetical protein